MEPISLVCTDCDAPFVFSVEEQQTYASRGFSTPKRCATCRATKRRRQKDGPRPRARPAAAVRATQPRPAAQWSPATCTTCGGQTEVPFRPDGVRAVYCLPCLKQRTR